MVDSSEILHGLLHNARMPQSLLFYGPSIASVEVFSAKLISSLLCVRGEGCGRCSECQSFAVGEHPEVFVSGNRSIEFSNVRGTAIDGPSADSAVETIKIEQIRNAMEHLGWHAATRADGRRSWRIVWIRQAANMTEQAANAFLKTLEEPPDGALIIMTARHPRMLLETLRSRLVALRIPGQESLPALPEDALKAVRNVLSGKALSLSLAGAEEISRQIRMKPAEFALAAELVLNQEYRKSLSTGKSLSEDFETRWRSRRMALAQLHRFAGRQRIVLNTQLAAEMAGPVAVMSGMLLDQRD